MNEDDSNSGFEMISSQPDQILYESVPEDKTYRFKLSSHHIKPKKVCYVLKKGLMLPYTTNSGGKLRKLFYFSELGLLHLVFRLCNKLFQISGANHSWIFRF